MTYIATKAEQIKQKEAERVLRERKEKEKIRQETFDATNFAVYVPNRGWYSGNNKGKGVFEDEIFPELATLFKEETAMKLAQKFNGLVKVNPGAFDA